LNLVISYIRISKSREGSHGIKTDPISQGDVGFCVFGIPEASEINFSREDTDGLMLGCITLIAEYV